MFSKNIIILIVFSLAALPSIAQMKYSIGPVATIGVSGVPESAGNWMDYNGQMVEPKLAYSVGILQRLRLIESISFEVGAVFSHTGFNLTEGYDSYNAALRMVTFRTRQVHEMRFNSYDLPINIRYHLPFKNGRLSFFAGISPSWIQSAKLTRTDKYENLIAEVKYEEIVEMELTDSDLPSLASIQFQMEKEFLLRANIGLTFRVLNHLEFGIDFQAPIIQNELDFWVLDYDILYTRKYKINDVAATFKVIYWLDDNY